MLLEGKVSIISGIGPGLGQELAYVFAREGSDVVLAARTESKLQEVAGRIAEQWPESAHARLPDRHLRPGADAAAGRRDAWRSSGASTAS